MNYRILITIAATTLAALVVGLLVIRLTGTSEDTGGGLSEEEISAAEQTGKAFLDKAGNYGLTEASFADPEAADRVDTSRPSPSYVSRALVTAQLGKEFFHPAAIYRVYAYRDEAQYNPYRVTTTLSGVRAEPAGTAPTGDPAVRVTADLRSELTFYGYSQGYLDKNNQPVPSQTFRVRQGWSEPVTLTVVQTRGGWRVLEVSDMRRVRVLAFQDPLGFHDDTVMGLPLPDTEQRQEIGAPR